MEGIKTLLENDPFLIVGASLVTGFIAGFAAFKAILGVGSFETIKKGTYILKENIVGNLLKNEAIAEIEKLIEIAEKMDHNKTQDVYNFMNRVLTFVHYLDLPKDTDETIGARSFVEREIDHTIRDIPNIGGAKASLDQKLNRIAGVLKGLKASFSSRFE